MITLADSSVLLDVLAPSAWRAWSEEQLARTADTGDVAINQVIYAEIAAGFASAERFERTLQGVGLKRLALPWAAAWRVAQAFARYRHRGGPHATTLPDFFIGAHAAVAGLMFLTATQAASGATSQTSRWSPRSPAPSSAACRCA